MGLYKKLVTMSDTYGLSILSYIFYPFLQQERDRKMWIEEQVKMLMKDTRHYVGVLLLLTNKIKIMVKKILCFLGICLAVLGVIGGIGYSAYNGAWHIAIGVGYCGYLAWPRIMEMVNKLSE